MKKFLGIFDKRPLIWLHYVLLVLAIYGLFLLATKFLPGFISFVWWEMLIFWFIAISVSDQLIHAVLKVD